MVVYSVVVFHTQTYHSVCVCVCVCATIREFDDLIKSIIIFYSCIFSLQRCAWLMS